MRQKFKLMLISVLTVAVIGVLQFLGCTWIAMANFPEGFSFSENFLSELGIQSLEYHTTYNGSLIFLGLSIIPSFVLLWLTNLKRLWSLMATSILGTISGAGLIGMGVFTVEREFILHYVSLAIWMFPMLYMTISFFFAVSRSEYVGIGFLSASLLMVIAMLVVLLRAQVTSHQLLHIFVVCCGLIWFGYVIAYIWQIGFFMLKNWDRVEDHTSEENVYFATLLQDKQR